MIFANIIDEKDAKLFFYKTRKDFKYRLFWFLVRINKNETNYLYKQYFYDKTEVTKFIEKNDLKITRGADLL